MFCVIAFIYIKAILSPKLTTSYYLFSFLGTKVDLCPLLVRSWVIFFELFFREGIGRLHGNAPQSSGIGLIKMEPVSELTVSVTCFRCRLFSLLYLKCTTDEEDEQWKPL
jgi:hypothetical protein